MRIKISAVLAAALLARMARTAEAGGGAATDTYEDIQPGRPVDVHGLADVYIAGNFNSPASGTNQLRAFDSQANAPSVGLLRATLAHAPDPVGFRLDLAAGDLTLAYFRSDPAASRYPALSYELSHLEQALVTVKVPVGRGLTLDVGKFGTPIGLEDNESLENWNYSRSFLYFLAEPSYHTGFRATYAPLETLAFTAFWENGWDANVLEGDGMRSFALAATWTPKEGMEVALDYTGGLERAPTQLASPALAYRSMFDAYATHEVTREISIAATADYGHDEAARGVWWWGVGGYARAAPREWLAFTLRAETYDDPQGFTSGTRQRLEEITGTAEIREHAGPLTVVSRIEYRHDESDAHVFRAGAGLSPRQDTLGAALIASFCDPLARRGGGPAHVYAAQSPRAANPISTTVASAPIARRSSSKAASRRGTPPSGRGAPR